MGVVSLLSERSARSPTSPGRVSERQVLPLLGLGRGCSQRTQKAFGTAMRLCASLFRGVAAPLGCVICLQLGDVAVFSLCAQYFLNVRGGGRYLHPRTVSHGSETLRGQVSERQTLPLLRLDPVCSRRTQRAFGTAMRLCASLFRGAAAPLGCVILFLLSKLWLVCHALRVFPRVRDMGGITTLGVLCVLLKRRTAACQNGSFVVF